jgi:hypothetical protein
MAQARISEIFSSEENFTEFHQYCNRLLEAPTVELTHAMQVVIVTWLKSQKEDVAANWFETYWTSEHGNYTNAMAGYVGNNKSAGIESHWKYMRRDTVGVAGSGKRTGLKTFIPVEKSANPFNTKRVKELKAAQAAEEAQAAPNWKLEVCVFESARAGSAVALAMQRQSGASSKVVELVAAEPLPSSVQAEVDASLQKPLDPKRLVGSRGKGPVKPRL